MGKYQVIVGNIGTVYDGNNLDQATTKLDRYVQLSKSSSGRVAGENVVLLEDGEMMEEYFGSNPEESEVTFDELKKAFCDVLDGNYQPYEIQAQTGMTVERCEEISSLFKRLVKS